MLKPQFEKLENALKRHNKAKAYGIIKRITASNCSPEDYWTITSLCLNHNFPDQGIKNFKQLLKLSPVSAEVIIPFLDKDDTVLSLELRLRLAELAFQADRNNGGIKLALGILLSNSDRFDKAESMFIDVIETGFMPSATMLCLSEVYYKQNRYHDAMASSQMAVELEPDNPKGYYFTGLVHVALNNFTEAVQFLKKTIEMEPEHPGAHINLAQIMLKLGFFDEGWQHHEWRFFDPKGQINKITFPFPQWRGSDLKGKSLLVWVDQGLGDQMMAATFFNRLLDAGCRLSVMADARLESLFNNSFNLEAFFPFNESGLKKINNQVFDFHISMGTLPAYFIHCFEDFSGEAFLKPDPDKVMRIREKLKADYPEKMLIGFGWRGGLSATRKYARNIVLSNWRQVLSRPDCQFINFQYDSTKEEADIVASYGGISPDIDTRNDIDNLAAYIAALDLFISADNSNVHLAGAIGTPVWNLVPFSGEWRWFLDETNSYWYDSMTLQRQVSMDSWEEVFQRFNNDLDHFVQ